MAPSPQRVIELGLAYLERQAWFEATAAPGGSDHRLVEATVLLEGAPGLSRLIVERGGRTYQVLLGWRRATDAAKVLAGREGALIGSTLDGQRRVLVYDALADDELARALLELATDGAQHAERVRRVTSRFSHASLVYDERLFMKCYRVLEAGVRPEVEVVLGLDRVGFNALAAPMGHWSVGGLDLALVREFLPAALEGRLLALTSLRDLLAHASDAGEAPGSRVRRAIAAGASAEDLERATAAAGGDLASELRRLGATTASMHRALAGAFGEGDLDPAALASAFSSSTRRSPVGVEGERPTGAELGAELARAPSATLGRAIRIHGDFHLRRVLRADPGWLVAGFADDPLYGPVGHDVSLPARHGSPVEDLADMWFSLRAVATEALAAYPVAEAPLAAALANAWVRRNQAAFLGGYLDSDDAADLLPLEPRLIASLLAGFVALRLDRYEATSD